MGTRGILYVYYNEHGHCVKTQAFYIHCDSKVILLEVRKKFLRVKTCKGFERLINSLNSDTSFRLDTDAPQTLEASYCYPFLEYSLEVNVHGFHEEKNNFQVLVNLVRETISETEFKPVKGQRRQDQRSPEEKAADKERKEKLQRARRKMIEWSDDGIHGHELCLQREWKAEIGRIDDEERKAQLRRLIEESKARLPKSSLTQNESVPASPKRKIIHKKSLGNKEKAKQLAVDETHVAAEIMLELSMGPRANAPRSELAPWIAN